MNLHRLVTIASLSLSATLGACASVPREEAPVARVHIPTLERLCIDREGEAAFSSASRGSTRTCYLMPPAPDDGDSRALELVRPEETVWSRVTSGAGGHRDQHIAHGQFKDRATGTVRWNIGEDGRIVDASLMGQVGVSWRWDPQGLAQLDLMWADRQVTINGRPAATRVQVGFGGAHYWESTVMTRPDEERALEAWLADGRMDVPYPEGQGELAAFPICPLGDREVWDDFNGRFPRVMRCLRGDAEWLRIERDDRGRIVTIAERRLSGAEGGSGANERALRISWHAVGLVPERVWVELDARKEGLEAHFSSRGVPEVTRIHKRGQLEGLAVIWERARAKGARMYSAGVAVDLDVVTRWSEGKKVKAPPELKFGLRDEERAGEDPVAGEADASLVWPAE